MHALDLFNQMLITDWAIRGCTKNSSTQQSTNLCQTLTLAYHHQILTITQRTPRKIFIEIRQLFKLSC